MACQLNISHKYKSSNFDSRKKKINYIVIHYTETKTLKKALDLLTDKIRRVSCHYIIDTNGKTFNLVNLSDRAWHAGDSKWKKSSDINSRSIGIELVNAGEEKIERFKNKQINSLIRLIIFLKKKFKICNSKILGHSDIAPLRKIDPGIHFPWKKLHKESIGLWTKDRIDKSNLNKKEYLELITNLKKIGYCYMETSNHSRNKIVINAFHRHHLPKMINKDPNKSSLFKSRDLIKLKKN
ncbi:MAG: N-acetylmuramoyl-L-alanine amidase [Rickettsiales bacterium]|nr:N-acetylmuramoyl-L-alanine amidase [Rickettsiales bacterium]